MVEILVKKGVKMPLSGVNKICISCSKKCKQFAQVKIIKCPNRVPKNKVKVG
jgi:hypothetical protein